MPRSRSSFDLETAIATAASLSNRSGADELTAFDGVALVSFQHDADMRPSAASSTPAQDARATRPAPPSPATRPPAQPSAPPPRLPDLSSVVSPILRCEKIVQWITEATGATGVFLADSAGLPLAGAVYDGEARLAGSGTIASSVQALASTIPGSASPLFEMHVGEGPFFQLIGFQAGSALYVVGLTRPTPLTPRQAHAIRLACRHALGTTLQGGA